MRRRSFFLGVAAAIASPKVARLESSVRRVGVLLLYAADDPVARGPMSAFREALREFGWTEGQDLAINFRFAGGDADRMRAAASDLIEGTSDVIVVQSPSIIREIRRQSLVPVVFASSADPVQVGLIATPSHPKRNCETASFYAALVRAYHLDQVLDRHVRMIAQAQQCSRQA
jgi:putative ABC transport system substrate-binding protein